MARPVQLILVYQKEKTCVQEEKIFRYAVYHYLVYPPHSGARWAKLIIQI